MTWIESSLHFLTMETATIACVGGSQLPLRATFLGSTNEESRNYFFEAGSKGETVKIWADVECFFLDLFELEELDILDDLTFSKSPRSMYSRMHHGYASLSSGTAQTLISSSYPGSSCNHLFCCNLITSMPRFNACL